VPTGKKIIELVGGTSSGTWITKFKVSANWCSFITVMNCTRLYKAGASMLLDGSMYVSQWAVSINYGSTTISAVYKRIGT